VFKPLCHHEIAHKLAQKLSLLNLFLFQKMIFMAGSIEADRF